MGSGIIGNSRKVTLIPSEGEEVAVVVLNGYTLIFLLLQEIGRLNAELQRYKDNNAKN